MNERIKELEAKCYVLVEGDRIDRDTNTFEDHVVFDKNMFAELIVKECTNVVLHYTDVDEGVAVARKQFGVE